MLAFGLVCMTDEVGVASGVCAAREAETARPQFGALTEVDIDPEPEAVAKVEWVGEE